jgi:hypothetical protein
MPCACDGMDEMRRDQVEEEANQATRAACDMRTILRRNNLELELTEETRKWIMRHDIADARRIAEENASGLRERTKRTALAKLSLEERRVLGL